MKGKSPEQILAAAKAYGYVHTDAEQIMMDHAHSYYTVFESIVHTETEKEYYVSAKKDNYHKRHTPYEIINVRKNLINWIPHCTFYLSYLNYSIVQAYTVPTPQMPYITKYFANMQTFT